MNRTEKLEYLALLEEQDRRAKGRKIWTYFPDEGPLRRELYHKHLAFFAAGKIHRERVFMAGNRVGKCIAGSTLIESPDGYSQRVDQIKGPHLVWAWDGTKRIPAWAEKPFTKPPEMIYRVWLQSGRYVDCAAEHRFLSESGWIFLSDLFEYVPILPETSSAKGLFYGVADVGQQQFFSGLAQSIWDIFLSTLHEGVLSLMKKYRDFLGDYRPEYHSNDVRLPVDVKDDQVVFPSRDDVRRHNLAWSHRDGLVDRYKCSRHDMFSRLSIQDVYRRILGLFAEFLNLNPCIVDGSYRNLFRESLQSPHGLRFQPQSNSVNVVHQHRSILPLLLTPDGATDSVIYCQKIGVQPIYDFHVPEYKNYCTGGLIHHNTETGGGYEIVLHLTGMYPHWWNGRRFNRPISSWAAGNTGKTVREIIQAKLLGKPGQHGSGLIPSDRLLRTTPKQGVPEAVDSIYVQHVSGGVSQLVLKSYDQKREAFEGTEQDVIWLDEEPELSVYTECLLRTMTCDGIVMLTFTPLLGMSETVMQFLPGGEISERSEGSRCVIMASWDDAPHLTEKMKEELLASIPPFQRDARSKGIPQLGSGAIYPVPETEIVVTDFQMPDHWPRGYGMDVGWNRTSAGFHAWDRENDVVYRYSEHYRGQAEPSIHADAIKARGLWIPGVIDPASRGRSQEDGRQLIQLYIDLGLDLDIANNAVEAGIYEMWQRLSTGRYRVFKSCQNWLTEYRLYRRDEKGRIVKSNDHAMDESRYFIMSGLSRSKVKPAKEERQIRTYNSGGMSTGWMG